MRSSSHAPILVVEDNLADFTALSRAFSKHAVPNPLVHCTDGEQVLHYFQHPPRPVLPVLVLLDLNMPGLSGKEVLKVLKQDPVLRIIPVIILTVSSSERDVVDCYRLGANSYLIKPLAYGELEQKVGTLVRYWLQEAELPSRS